MKTHRSPYTHHESAACDYANASGLKVYYGTGYAIPSPHALVIDYGHETVVYLFPCGDDGLRDAKSGFTRKVFTGQPAPQPGDNAGDIMEDEDASPEPFAHVSDRETEY
jgi:hypothetical protein